MYFVNEEISKAPIRCFPFIRYSKDRNLQKENREHGSMYVRLCLLYVQGQCKNFINAALHYCFMTSSENIFTLPPLFMFIQNRYRTTDILRLSSYKVTNTRAVCSLLTFDGCDRFHNTTSKAFALFGDKSQFVVCTYKESTSS